MEGQPVSGRRSVNLVSMWIVVIFSVIAATLVAMLLLVYGSIRDQELRYTLREQITVLADNADAQVMEPLRMEAVRRLALKAGFSDLMQAVCGKAEADSQEIRTLAGWCAEVNAAIPQSSRVDIYFPDRSVVVGSEGVRFLADKKYAVQASNYAFLEGLKHGEAAWMRQIFHESVDSAPYARDVPYIVYVRPCPGIFPRDNTPVIVTSVQEERFHALLQKALRTLNEDDAVFLTDFEGTVWSAREEAFVGTRLPLAESALQAVKLQNGASVLLAENGDSTGSFNYVLVHPDGGWLRRYDSAVSMWAALCVGLLILGMIGVLRVLMTNYAQPMKRLMRHFAIPEARRESRLISSPSEHFTQIETALMDMTRDREERERFLVQSRPQLRAAWLNCLISGEASYTAPMPQLEIVFPHSLFQAVVSSSRPAEDQEKRIMDCLEAAGFTVAAFDSREKERVYLVNHDQGEDAVPKALQRAAEKLPPDGSVSFGVGILAATADMIPASFRCARRALSSRYFDQKSVVCVFDPGAAHMKSEDAPPQLIAQFNNLVGLIRRQSVEEVDRTIDDLVSRLREGEPSLSFMRGIMLLAAASLCKAAYDMKNTPEAVYGDDLMNVYYHIEDINEFAARLKLDSRALSACLSRESSESNRSLVQYAIHHIHSMPPAELSQQSIADALSISTGHLSRVFHQETGKKLVDYLQEVRMKHAARLLSEGRLTNEQICEAIGYSRLQYFSAKFKEYYGLTLTEYRRKSRYEGDGAPQGHETNAK